MTKSVSHLRYTAAFFLLELLLLNPTVRAQDQTTTYHFVGTPLNHCSDDSSGTVVSITCPQPPSPDSPRGRISGFFSVPQPLPPNFVSPNGIGGPGDFQPSSFCFTDGVTTINDANGATNASGGFSVNTDAQGNLTQWSVGVRWNGTPPPGLAGDTRTYFGPSSGGGVVARSGAQYEHVFLGYLSFAGDPGGTWTIEKGPGSCDLAVISNQLSDASTGVLVNGLVNGEQKEHLTAGPIAPTPPETTSNTISLGANVKLSSADHGNELIAFSFRRPPTLKTDVKWTDGSDSIPLAFPDEIRLKIKFWAVGRDFTTDSLLALFSYAHANTVLVTERLGAKLQIDRPIEDRTSFFNSIRFPPGKTPQDACPVAEQLVSKVGFAENEVNIYIIPALPGAVVGVNCDRAGNDGPGGSVILLSESAPSETLVHELGHAFGLHHPIELPEPNLCPQRTKFFDGSNVMWPCVGTYFFLTEGQTFRANYLSSSVIIFLYSARPSQPAGLCSQVPLECPDIKKRIWADGQFPPN